MFPRPSTVMSIFIEQSFVYARSVGPFGPPEEEKGVKHMFFLLLEKCFSRDAWNLFDVGNPFFFFRRTERPDRTGTNEVLFDGD